MSRGNLLSIHPIDELKFPFELNKQTSSSSLRLTNKSDELYVAFKFKTTNPKKYRFRPNKGIVLPGTTCQVTVTMQAPLDLLLQCKDKFLVQTTIVQAPTITPETFNKESGKVVEECKFRVIYVVPPANSPPAPPTRALSPSSQPVIDVPFRFELNKQSSSTLSLTNPSSHRYLAFKVKTTNPKKYCVYPNMGTVLPGTTFYVTITMQAQKEAPLECKDKFLVQMFDLREMFNNPSSTALLKEFKFRATTYVPVGSSVKKESSLFTTSRVRYVLVPEQQGSSPPTAPCTVENARGSEQQGFSQPSASFVENGSQTSSLFDAVARLIGLGSRGKKKLHSCRDDSMSSSSTASLLGHIR